MIQIISWIFLKNIDLSYSLASLKTARAKIFYFKLKEMQQTYFQESIVQQVPRQQKHCEGYSSDLIILMKQLTHRTIRY